MSQSQSDFFNYFQKRINDLNNYCLEIGVFTTKNSRKIQIGLNNAELLFIHENGSPLRNIPSRPVLQLTIDYANKHLISATVDKCIKMILDGKSDADIKLELDKLAMKIEKYAKRLIYSNDGRLVANAPSTVAKKGFNHPLFHTSQLARSITCRVVKI